MRRIFVFLNEVSTRPNSWRFFLSPRVVMRCLRHGRRWSSGRLRVSAAHTAVGTPSRRAPRDSRKQQQTLSAIHCSFYVWWAVYSFQGACRKTTAVSMASYSVGSEIRWVQELSDFVEHCCRTYTHRSTPQSKCHTSVTPSMQI